MEKITIRELAQMAVVSQTAVSFVLNNKPGVSEETRRRVLDIIEKTNYRANRNSKRLAMNKTFNICLAYISSSSPFNDLFYFDITKILLDKSADLGYNIVLTKLESEDGVMTMPDIIADRDADGVILMQDVEPQVIHSIESLDLPCVVLDSYTNDQHICSVGMDARHSSYIALKYLMDRGHKKIGLIASSYIPEFWMQIYAGYTQALSERSLSIDPGWVRYNAVDEESAYACTEQILATGDLPTALFCAGDIYAVGAIRCIQDHGLRVPEDISILGCDNIILGKYITPALTTINPSKDEMSQYALDLLLHRMDGAAPEHIRLPSSLIIERDSVRDLRF